MSSRKRRGEESRNDEVSNSTSTVTLSSVLNTNFEELARQIPSFGAIWRQNSSLQTPEVRCALASALLWMHWNISMASLPLVHLAPPIPNRYFFVRWLLDSVLPQTVNNDGPPIGLDIGTGAYCVYPLLFVASNPCVQMHATDVDPNAIQFAHEHLRLNARLSPRIRLHHVPPTDRQQQCQKQILSGPLSISLQAIGSQTQLTFCMTNPPFYDVNEATTNVSPMTVNEGRYPEGEVGFCLDIIVDGLALFLQATKTNSTRGPPIWTSTMCGKKSTWTYLHNVLGQLLGFSHICATEFAPKQLTRWFLAWTFESQPATSPLAHHMQWQFDVPHTSVPEIEQRIRTYCASFPPKGNLVCTTSHTSSVTPDDSWLEITEQRSYGTSPWKGDDGLPEIIRYLLAHHSDIPRDVFLPAQGHFLLRVHISVHRRVQLDAHIHSSNGRAVIAKIRNQLGAEICRTNRQWRRKLRQQQQNVPPS